LDLCCRTREANASDDMAPQVLKAIELDQATR